MKWEESAEFEKFTPITPHSHPPFSPIPHALLCPLCPPQETGRYPAYKEMVSEYCWLDRRK